MTLNFQIFNFSYIFDLIPKGICFILFWPQSHRLARATPSLARTAPSLARAAPSLARAVLKPLSSDLATDLLPPAREGA